MVGGEGQEERAPASFYDDLAGAYHLIFEDWDAVIEYTGEVLEPILRSQGHGPPSTVLDCSCGIGTQALGLAPRGYDVFGTDLSAPSIERARREAAGRGLPVSFEVADMRDLGDVGGLAGRRFDVVISCDNSLPHLLTDADLELALRSIKGRLRPGGLLLASMRDYDELVAHAPAPVLRHGQGGPPGAGSGRPPGTLPQMIRSPQGRRVVVQTWTWQAEAPVYDLELFLIVESAQVWRTTSFCGRYRAYLRSEVDAQLVTAGFEDVRWAMPQDSGYYQPMVLARAPG